MQEILYCFGAATMLQEYWETETIVSFWKGCEFMIPVATLFLYLAFVPPRGHLKWLQSGFIPVRITDIFNKKGLETVNYIWDSTMEYLFIVCCRRIHLAMYWINSAS